MIAALALVGLPGEGIAQVGGGSGTTGDPERARLQRADTVLAREGSPVSLDDQAQIRFENLRPAEALDLLRDRTGIRILFSPSLLPARAVTCDCSEGSIREVLGVILEGTGFTFVPVRDQVLIELEGEESIPVEGAVETASPGEFLGGAVVDALRGDPITGALVSLLEPNGEVHRSILTASRGRFSFRLPGPGDWSLEVSRLGYEGIRSETIEVGEAGVASITLHLESAPLALDPVAVRAEWSDRCRRLGPDEGSLLVRMWEEARSALVVAAWAEKEERYEFDIQRWTRSTDLVTGHVIEEEESGLSRSFQPFATLPIEDLLAHGWIRKAGAPDTYDYYGLDAATLLSDPFQRSHCFEIREHPDDGTRVGLGFSPERVTDHPSVRGTLWLDRETGALETLDFHYTSHPHSPPIPPAITPLFNGVVEFRRLPDGGWIADRWRLRMPQYHVVHASRVLTRSRNLVGFGGELRDAIEKQPRWWQNAVRHARLGSVEMGGEIRGIRTPGGDQLPARDRAALEGIVIDSTRMHPLAGAAVHLVGTGHRARTDRFGRYRLEGPLEGRFAVHFHHSRLDSLDLESFPDRELVLMRGSTSRLDLGVPLKARPKASGSGETAGRTEPPPVHPRLVP